MKNTTICYIEQNNSYLMIHRIKKEHDENRDKWIGIGGKLEEGESPYDGIRREVLEETGLTLLSPRYRGIITFVSNEFGTQYMHLFKCTEFEGQISESCDEGVLEWIEKSKLLSLKLWEGDKIFLRLLDEDVPFFSLKLVYEFDELVEHKIDF